MSIGPDAFIVRSAEVHDGAGSPPRHVDVAVADGAIAAVGDDIGAAAGAREIDAAGLVLGPGFIDAHSHSDLGLLARPDCASKVLQGITTEVIGNCGFSAAPLRGACRERVEGIWAESELEIDWDDMAGFARRLAATPPAVNVTALVGHNNLRAAVMGYDDRPPTEHERNEMQRLAAEAMDQGAAGMSTGLAYSPGIFSRTDEIARVAEVVGARGGIYATHMRSEGNGLLESIDETLEIGRRAGARVQISHLKASGQANWAKLTAAIERIDAANAAGMEVAADRYPYTASWTDLDTVLPDWAFAGGTDAMVARLRDPETSARLVSELAQSRAADAWGDVRVASVGAPELAGVVGRSIAEIASERSVPPARAVIDLLRDDECRTGAFFFSMSEENMHTVLRHPRCVIGTDASARPSPLPPDSGSPHPRAFGTFARAVGDLVRDGLYPLAEAIHKSTAMTAEFLRIPGRGHIAPGFAADLVLFDPDAFADRTTWSDPGRPPAGLHVVWVNGVAVVRDGQLTGARPGRFLPGPGATR